MRVSAFRGLVKGIGVTKRQDARGIGEERIEGREVGLGSRQTNQPPAATDEPATGLP